MMMAPIAYRQQLQALLPSGPAWPRDDDAVLTKLLHGLADEFARLDGRAGDLVREFNPDEALELLADWERVLALPDLCVPTDPSTRARQRLAVQKLAARGGQSRAYFINLAATLGYEVEIDEFSAFCAGMGCDQPAYDDAWAFAWRVRVLAASDGPASVSAQITSSIFTAGSDAGEALRTFESHVIECVLSRAAPAHAVLIFAYELDPEPTLWFDFTEGE